MTRKLLMAAAMLAMMVLYTVPSWGAGPWYLRGVDGGDGDDCLSWANACDTMGGVLAKAVAAGDIIYVDDDHTETLAADTTWTFPGTEGVPNKVLVVTTDTTTAVSTYDAGCDTQYIEGDTGDDHIIIDGEVYFWGICLEAGDGSFILGSGETVTFEKSNLKLDAPVGTDAIYSTGEATRTVLINTDVEFADADDYFYVISGAELFWLGGTLTFDVNTLLNMDGAEPGFAEISGVDLSAINGGSLATVTGGTVQSRAIFKGCKLNATLPDLVDGPPPPGHGVIRQDICDSGNTVYKFKQEYQYGTAEHDVALYVAGLGQYDGTNEYSVKLTSRAAPTPTLHDPWRYHLATKRVNVNNTTVTAYIVDNGNGGEPTALQDDEVWLEVVYPNQADTQYTIQSDRIATPTTAAANQADDDGRWTGDTNGQEQKLVVTVADGDAKIGPVEFWLCIGKPSVEIYVCPEVVIP